MPAASTVFVLAAWGVAFSCFRTVSWYVLMCGIASGWRNLFVYLAAFRYGWIGAIGVFVCNDIPANIIIEPPPYWLLSLTQESYNVHPLCDKHGNRPSLRKLYALDSSIKRTRPQFAPVYLRWHLGRVHEVVCVWLTTPSLHKVDSHALPLPHLVSHSLFTSGPSMRSQSVSCCWASVRFLSRRWVTLV